MSEEEVSPVVVDLTFLVERLKGGIETEIKHRIYSFVVKALEQVILDLAKSELRKVVGEALREALTDGRVFSRPKVSYDSYEEWPDGAPPPAELTLKEYITLWLTRSKEFSWSKRGRLGDMLDRHLFQMSDEIARHVIEERIGELKAGLTDKLGGMVADKLVKRMGLE